MGCKPTSLSNPVALDLFIFTTIYELVLEVFEVVGVIINKRLIILSCHNDNFNSS
jgi:hypothetical protein